MLKQGALNSSLEFSQLTTSVDAYVRVCYRGIQYKTNQMDYDFILVHQTKHI